MSHGWLVVTVVVGGIILLVVSTCMLGEVVVSWQQWRGTFPWDDRRDVARGRRKLLILVPILLVLLLVCMGGMAGCIDQCHELQQSGCP